MSPFMIKIKITQVRKLETSQIGFMEETWKLGFISHLMFQRTPPNQQFSLGAVM